MTTTHKSRKRYESIERFFVGDKGAHQQPSANVLSAAQTLALALQQCNSSPPSPPDKETAEVINAWLESYMPVSVDYCGACRIQSLTQVEAASGSQSGPIKKRRFYGRIRVNNWVLGECRQETKPQGRF